MHTAGSCPGASPEAMDTEGLWGVVGDDLAVNDEVMSVSSPPPVPAAASEVLPPTSGMVEHLALPGVPRFSGVPGWGAQILAHILAPDPGPHF